MTLTLRPTPNGVVVPVRVVPRSARTAIDGVADGVLRVRLTAPPVAGAANRQLCEHLAEVLGVSRRDVELVGGSQSRQKTVLVRGLDAETVTARLRLG